MKNNLQVPEGTIATPVISPTAVTMAKCSIFMTGMKKEITSDSVKSKFEELLKEEHKALVKDVDLKKKDLVIIHCTSWDAAKTIATEYKDFNGEKVNFKLFYQQNPDSMQN